MMVLLLLLACTSSDPDRHTPKGPGDTGSPGEDTGETDETEDPPDTGDPPDPGSPTGCASPGTGRAWCALAGTADWATATLSGLQSQGEGLVLADQGLTSGTDTAGDMSGGAWAGGTVTSPWFSPGTPFDGVIPSWTARTPSGTWIGVEVRVRDGSDTSAWYRLGIWASGEGTVQRHSFEDEGDQMGTVWTDTVWLDSTASEGQVRVTLYRTSTSTASPTLERVTLAFARGDQEGEDAGGAAWGTVLDVPGRSQMEYEDGGGWCSPTSTSMILEYWSRELDRSDLDVTVPDAADGIYDHTYGGTGNWPFNTAYAGSKGLSGQVGWFSALSQLEPWIQAGHPVAISIAFDPGELDQSPISSTDGHLIVVRGFTEDGDVEVNDPAAPSSASVDRTYDRQQLSRAWLGGSTGVAYLIWDGDRPVER